MSVATLSLTVLVLSEEEKGEEENWWDSSALAAEQHQLAERKFRVYLQTKNQLQEQEHIIICENLYWW